MMHPLVYIIYQLLSVYSWIVIIYIILGWLVAFDIINRHQPFVQKVNEALSKVIDPVLRKIRRYMPDTGAVDLSPILLFLGINFIQYILVYYSTSGILAG